MSGAGIAAWRILAAISIPVLGQRQMQYVLRSVL
jgi:hypothetical protein